MIYRKEDTMKKIYMTLVFAALTVFSVYAQYGSVGSTDARSMGMGNTHNATAGGIYAIGINPANLLNDNSFISFSTILPLPVITIFMSTSAEESSS